MSRKLKLLHFDHFKIFFLSNVFLCVPCMCLVPAETRFPGTGFTELCEPPYGYWELNQSHLEEQLFS